MKEAKFEVTPHIPPHDELWYLDQDGMYGDARGLRIIVPDDVVGGKEAFKEALDSGERLTAWFCSDALKPEVSVEPIIVEKTSMLMTQQDADDLLTLAGVTTIPPVDPVKVIETVKAGIKAKIRGWLV